MTEYIGYKDPVGDGLCNMGITDEEVIRCRDCAQMGEVKPETGQPCSTDPDGFCAWAVRRA